MAFYCGLANRTLFSEKSPYPQGISQELSLNSDLVIGMAFLYGMAVYFCGGGEDLRTIFLLRHREL